MAKKTGSPEPSKIQWTNLLLFLSIILNAYYFYMYGMPDKDIQGRPLFKAEDGPITQQSRDSITLIAGDVIGSKAVTSTVAFTISNTDGTPKAVLYSPGATMPAAAMPVTAQSRIKALVIEAGEEQADTLAEDAPAAEATAPTEKNPPALPVKTEEAADPIVEPAKAEKIIVPPAKAKSKLYVPLPVVEPAINNEESRDLILPQ